MSRSPMRAAQQQDRREATKRHIMGAWMDESSKNNNSTDDSAFDGSNKAQVQLLIEDLQATFEKQMELMKTDVLSAKNEQVQVHRMSIVKLPKSVRQMTIREFNQAHDCNLLSMLKGKDGFVSQEGSKKRGHMAVAATPAPRARNQQCPATNSRTVRRGEKVYSQNGSPVDTADQGALIATVTKKRKGNEGANFEINVGDGKYISLNDPDGVEGLDESMKATAASQLKVLRDQMENLMAQLAN